MCGFGALTGDGAGARASTRNAPTAAAPPLLTLGATTGALFSSDAIVAANSGLGSSSRCVSRMPDADVIARAGPVPPMRGIGGGDGIGAGFFRSPRK
jgi:hypothetical protein